MADVEVLDAAAAQRVREGLHSAAQTLTMVREYKKICQGREKGKERIDHDGTVRSVPLLFGLLPSYNHDIVRDAHLVAWSGMAHKDRGEGCDESSEGERERERKTKSTVAFAWLAAIIE